jgi:mRNA-degrading endonuclease toxin of MazEF toxin-antitoxin module
MIRWSDMSKKAAARLSFLPITSGGSSARTAGFAVPLRAGTKTTGVIRCDQPRAVDLGARNGLVLARLAAIFE